MRINALQGSQSLESESLRELNINNLSLKSLCSRTFDGVMNDIF